MMNGYIDKDGNYYEGDRQDDDQEVPQRPSPNHEWNGTAWISGVKCLAAMWEAIKSERDRRTQKGGYKVGTAWFHSDVFSRSQQIGLVMLGANIPASLQWKTMDGTFVTMTQTLAGQVFAAAAASDQAIFSAAEAHRAEMEASATPETYDFSTGWPKVYGEV